MHAKYSNSTTSSSGGLRREFGLNLFVLVSASVIHTSAYFPSNTEKLRQRCTGPMECHRVTLAIQGEREKKVDRYQAGTSNRLGGRLLRKIRLHLPATNENFSSSCSQPADLSLVTIRCRLSFCLANRERERESPVHYTIHQINSLGVRGSDFRTALAKRQDHIVIIATLNHKIRFTPNGYICSFWPLRSSLLPVLLPALLPIRVYFINMEIK